MDSEESRGVKRRQEELRLDYINCTCDNQGEAKGNQGELRGIKGSQEESSGVKRIQEELRGVKKNQDE